MTSHPPSLAEHFAGLRAALQPQTGELRPHAGALDVMLLTLLSALLGRLVRLARAWHPAPTQEDSDQEADAPLFPVALLYLFGPRRNRGMRPHARTTPIVHPRTARAPPSQGAPKLLPPTPQTAKRPQTGPQCDIYFITISTHSPNA